MGGYKCKEGDNKDKELEGDGKSAIVYKLFQQTDILLLYSERPLH